MHKLCNLQTSEIGENDTQKKLKPLLQIYSQNRHMNHDFAGMLQLRSDPTQRITPFADSETSFNVSPITRFQPLKVKFLFADLRILRRLAKARTVEMDAVFFAVPEIVPRAVYGV